MRRELLVAEKEFRDYVTSKRFFIILAILMLLSVYSMITGVNSYNDLLNTYKDKNSTGMSWRWEAADTIQKQIQQADAQGSSQTDVQALKQQYDILVNPIMPSIVEIFKNTVALITVVGAILGISMGFDVISKEKEDGTLRTLLSSPLYRDMVINGKAIGAVMTLSIVLAVTFILTIAIMIIYGIIPTAEDTTRIILYYFSTVLYCTVFFAIAMMTSTIAKNSTMSIIYTIGIVFVLIISSMLSYAVANVLSDTVIGPKPVDPSQAVGVGSDQASVTMANTTNTASTPMVSQENARYIEASEKYEQQRQKLLDAVTTISPLDNFCGSIGYINGGISGYILTKEKYEMHNYIVDILPYTERVSIEDSLAAIWYKVLVLILEIFVAFAISYVAFMRMDIR